MILSAQLASVELLLLTVSRDLMVSFPVPLPSFWFTSSNEKAGWEPGNEAMGLTF